jgi:hypothetical protein
MVVREIIFGESLQKIINIFQDKYVAKWFDAAKLRLITLIFNTCM